MSGKIDRGATDAAGGAEPGGRRHGEHHATGRAAGDSASPAQQPPVKRTRTSITWTMFAVGSLVLLIILVFILQNDAEVQVKFLALEGTLPLGVALLFGVVLGALLVAVVGAARIGQLRMVARRRRRAS